MKRFKKILSLALAGVMLVSSAVMFTGCSGDAVEEPQENSIPVVNDKGEVMETVTAFTQSMTYFGAANAVAEDGVIATNTVHCTVTPYYATVKTTTWALKWGDGASRASESVEKYIRITPCGTDNNDCKIDLLSYFGEDSTILTVTTVDGGFSASCELKCFEGVKITQKNGELNLIDWECEATGEQYTFVDFETTCSDLFSVNIDSRYRDAYSITIEGIDNGEGGVYFENSDGDKVLISSVIDEIYGVGTYPHIKGYGYYSAAGSSNFNAHSESAFNIFHSYSFVENDISFTVGVQTRINPPDSIYSTFDEKFETSLYQKLSENGYEGYKQVRSIYATFKPVIYKITVTDNTFNTSDSVYISIRIPAEGVSASEAYTYQH